MRSWKPGHGWRTAIRNTSWWHHNFDGTITARAVVHPKMMPGCDGGEWTQPELWTVRLPLAEDDPTRMRPWWKPWRHYWMAPGPVYMLNDKPHRITWWDADHPDRKVLNRQPLPADLIASIEAEEKRFERHMRHVCCYIGPVHVPAKVYDAWQAIFQKRRNR